MLISGRETVRNELVGWFGDAYEKIEIAATFNLILNAANMVKNGVDAARRYDFGSLSDVLTFVPLSPHAGNGHGAGVEEGSGMLSGSGAVSWQH